MKKTRLLMIVLALCVVLSLGILSACDGLGGGGDAAKTLKSISVDGAAPSEFVVGETFSAEGLTVKVTFSDDSTVVVTLDKVTVDSTAFKKDVPGTYPIVIKYTYEGEEKTVSYEVTVKAAEISEKTDPTYTLPTGLTAVYGQTLSEVTLPTGFTWNDATESVGAVGARVHTATFTPTDTAKYNILDDLEITVTVGKATNAWTTEAAIQDWTYGEIAKIPVGEARTGSVNFTFALDGATPEFSATVPTNAGAYIMKAIATAENYNDLVATVSFNISKAANTWTANAAIQNWVYGAVASTPSATPAHGTVAYTYAPKNTTEFTETVPTLAGEYVLKAVATDDNYATLTDTIDFVIDKKTVEAPSAGSATYNGQNQVSALTDTADYTVTSNLGGVNAGQYDVVLTLVDFANYKWADSATSTKTIGFLINKADPTPAPPVGLTAQYGDKIIAVNFSDSCFSWKSPDDAVGEVGDRIHVAVYTPADTSNYNVIEVNVTVTVNSRVLGYSADGYTGKYDNASHTISVNPFVQGAVISYGTVEGTYNLTEAPTYTTVGSYTVYFKIEASNFETAESSRTVVISKATIDIDSIPTVEGDVYVIEGMTLADVTLTGGSAIYLENESVEGSFEWLEPTTAVSAGYSLSYEAVFIPTDSTNFDTETTYVSFDILRNNYDLSEVEWSAQRFTYDGTEKSVTLVNLPDGITIEYDNNTGTDCLAAGYGYYVSFFCTEYDEDLYNAPDFSTLGLNNYEWFIDPKTPVVNVDFTVPTDITGGQNDWLSDVWLPSGFNWVSDEGNIPTETSIGEGSTYTAQAYYHPVTETNDPNNNYNDSEAFNVVITILSEKVEAYTDGFKTYTYGDGQEHTVSLENVTPETATVKFGLTEDGCTLDDSPDFENAGTYYVYYLVTADGYVPLRGYITVQVNQALLTAEENGTLAPTELANGYYYNSQKINELTFTTEPSIAEDIAGTYTWNNGNNYLSVGEPNYLSYVFTPDDDNYAPYSFYFTITAVRDDVTEITATLNQNVFIQDESFNPDTTLENVVVTYLSGKTENLSEDDNNSISKLITFDFDSTLEGDELTAGISAERTLKVCRLYNETTEDAFFSASYTVYKGGISYIYINDDAYTYATNFGISTSREYEYNNTLRKSITSAVAYDREGNALPEYTLVLGEITYQSGILPLIDVTVKFNGNTIDTYTLKVNFDFPIVIVEIDDVIFLETEDGYSADVIFDKLLASDITLEGDYTIENMYLYNKGTETYDLVDSALGAALVAGENKIKLDLDWNGVERTTYLVLNRIVYPIPSFTIGTETVTVEDYSTDYTKKIADGDTIDLSFASLDFTKYFIKYELKSTGKQTIIIESQTMTLGIDYYDFDVFAIEDIEAVRSWISGNHSTYPSSKQEINVYLLKNDFIKGVSIDDGEEDVIKLDPDYPMSVYHKIIGINVETDEGYTADVTLNGAPLAQAIDDNVFFMGKNVIKVNVKYNNTTVVYNKEFYFDYMFINGYNLNLRAEEGDSSIILTETGRTVPISDGSTNLIVENNEEFGISLTRDGETVIAEANGNYVLLPDGIYVITVTDGTHIIKSCFTTLNVNNEANNYPATELFDSSIQIRYKGNDTGTYINADSGEIRLFGTTVDVSALTLYGNGEIDSSLYEFSYIQNVNMVRLVYSPDDSSNYVNAFKVSFYGTVDGNKGFNAYYFEDYTAEPDEITFVGNEGSLNALANSSIEFSFDNPDAGMSLVHSVDYLNVHENTINIYQNAPDSFDLEVYVKATDGTDITVTIHVTIEKEQALVITLNGSDTLSFFDDYGTPGNKDFYVDRISQQGLYYIGTDDISHYTIVGEDGEAWTEGAKFVKVSILVNQSYLMDSDLGITYFNFGGSNPNATVDAQSLSAIIKIPLSETTAGTPYYTISCIKNIPGAYFTVYLMEDQDLEGMEVAGLNVGSYPVDLGDNVIAMMQIDPEVIISTTGSSSIDVELTIGNDVSTALFCGAGFTPSEDMISYITDSIVGGVPTGTVSINLYANAGVKFGIATAFETTTSGLSVTVSEQMQTASEGTLVALTNLPIFTMEGRDENQQPITMYVTGFLVEFTDGTNVFVGISMD